MALTYECVVHGFYNSVVFGSRYFYTPEKFGGIQVGQYGMDYIHTNSPNLLPYGPPRGRNYKRTTSKVDNFHFDVTSPEITKKAYEIAKKDYEAYLACKKKLRRRTSRWPM